MVAKLSRGDKLFTELLLANPLLPHAVGTAWEASGYVSMRTPGNPAEYTIIKVHAKYNNGSQSWAKTYPSADAAVLLPVLKDWLDVRFPEGMGTEEKDLDEL